jgi:hypothetical protein
MSCRTPAIIDWRDQLQKRFTHSALTGFGGMQRGLPCVLLLPERRRSKAPPAHAYGPPYTRAPSSASARCNCKGWVNCYRIMFLTSDVVDSLRHCPPCNLPMARTAQVSMMIPPWRALGLHRCGAELPLQSRRSLGWGETTRSEAFKRGEKADRHLSTRIQAAGSAHPVC